ncbi:MAG: TAXI family TRAP transporter solute-binding subunit [Chloroflexi bacterium]|nr:TAXI family TRAP transporter solute-binding subunit [Chloroflexota bacterium]
MPAGPPAQPTAGAGGSAAAPAGAPSRLTMGTSSSTSSYYAYNVALARLLQSKVPGLNVTVSEGGGTSLNATLMRDDKIDFSLAGFAALYLPYAGLDPAWQEKPFQDARTLWLFDPAAQVWYVREDSGVTTIEQLNGKEFSPGGKGSATEVIATKLAFPAIGVQPKWYTGGYDDALTAMKDKRIVGTGKATAIARPDALIQDAMVSMKIRILSWTPEQIQKAKEKYPFLSTTEIPAGVYKADWNEKPITTWQDGIGMFTRAKFSNDVAYAFTKAAVEDNKEGGEQVQSSAFTAMKGADLVKLTMDLATVPLHAGSYKYFSEIGVQIPDRLKPPEVK